MAAVGGFGASPKAFVKEPPPKLDYAALMAAVGGGGKEPAVLTAPPPKPVEPQTLVRLGTDKANLRVLLNTKGGGVQQVILPRFDEATRLGIRAKENGATVPLHLIPGIVRTRTASMLDTPPYPNLAPGVVADPSILTDPSYLLTHYPVGDDPKSPTQHPVNELAERVWTVAEPANADDGSRVTFETDLGAPYHIRIRKTFTLKPGEYHFGFQLSFDALPGRAAGKEAVKFRYQLAGANALPIEGEWYTSTYRNALIGWTTPSGTPTRSIEDTLTIQNGHGGTLVKAEGNTFTYAAVANQYFASALAIDDTQPEEVRKGMWQYARPTREPLPWQPVERNDQGRVKQEVFTGGIEEKVFLGNVTVRVAAAAIDPQPGKPVTHGYLVYNGPVKVRLLDQLKGADGTREVEAALVDRYLDNLTLRTLTDHHSPHFFGRLSNSLWIADLVIFFTNVMHTVLGWLHGFVPIWGVNVLMLTFLVRLMLLIPSKKQQGMMARMQEKMTKLKPEVDKLKEKYGSDYHTFNQERTRLMMRNGVNPLSSMGGCLLMLAQFPIFMGLYFCLQESVFFRLEPFLWMPNLAAPDMLAWWGENIPWVSDPNSLGGTLYLGPYLNILPILTIGLMVVQQAIMMPPPTDEQQAMNAKIMKVMMIFMGIFFYKMAAGMCLYFIASTTWALIERRFVKKAVHDQTVAADELAAGAGPVPLPARAQSAKPADPAPAPTGFLARMRAKLEEVQRQAEQQRQIRNNQTPPQQGPPPKPGGQQGGGGQGGKGGKKKKKK
jgi:YidC/Oxa1 family membrane protein insertase